MARVPEIICFRHNHPGIIYCKNIREICPICQLPITDYTVPPFTIPYPYRNAVHEPNKIVIRPSQGNFLNDYEITNDLHIGVVNSDGIVFEFDEDGLIINDPSKWTDCIAITMIEMSWKDRWDETLALMLNSSKWKSSNYNEITLNCFDFVIEFLNNLNCLGLDFVSKEDICSRLLLSRIKLAIKYNSIFKTLEDHEYFVLSEKN